MVFAYCRIYGPVIVDFSLPISNAFIDRQFGGYGNSKNTEVRPMTSVGRTIMGKVVTRTLADLEATWKPLLKVRVSDAELETNPEFMQVAGPSDTVNMQYAFSCVEMFEEFLVYGFGHIAIDNVLPTLGADQAFDEAGADFGYFAWGH